MHSPILKSTICFFGFVLLVAIGCNPPKNKQAADAEDNDPVLFVSNYPLQFFAEELTGGAIEVIGPDDRVKHPSTWVPDDEIITRMQKADVLFSVGADYENWTRIVTYDDEKLLEVGRGLYKSFIEVEGEVHKHGPDGEEHTHSGLANAFWLDPALAKQMVDVMAEKLQEVYPERKDEIAANRDKLNSKFEKLETLIEETSPRYSTVFSSDTRYQYLTKRIGIQDVYYFWTGHGKEELPENAWKILDENLKVYPASLMLFPVEPKQKTVDQLGERRIRVLQMDTIETPNDQGDYFERMEKVIRALSIE